MKINWGWSIVIALAAFIIFISTIVFQLMFDKKYDHQLVSENYYKDELLYQLELNKLENAKKLPENLKIQIKEGQLALLFPPNMNPQDIKAHINLQYVIDAQYDFEQTIALDSTVYILNSTPLKRGTWYVKVDWSYLDVAYMLKEKIIY